MSCLNLLDSTELGEAWFQASGQVQVCSVCLSFGDPSWRSNGHLGHHFLMEDGRNARQDAKRHSAS